MIINGDNGQIAFFEGMESKGSRANLCKIINKEVGYYSESVRVTFTL